MLQVLSWKSYQRSLLIHPTEPVKPKDTMILWWAANTATAAAVTAVAKTMLATLLATMLATLLASSTAAMLVCMDDFHLICHPGRKPRCRKPRCPKPSDQRQGNEGRSDRPACWPQRITKENVKHDFVKLQSSSCRLNNSTPEKIPAKMKNQANQNWQQFCWNVAANLSATQLLVNDGLTMLSSSSKWFHVLSGMTCKNLANGQWHLQSGQWTCFFRRQDRQVVQSRFGVVKKSLKNAFMLSALLTTRISKEHSSLKQLWSHAVFWQLSKKANLQIQLKKEAVWTWKPSQEQKLFSELVWFNWCHDMHWSCTCFESFIQLCLIVHGDESWFWECQLFFCSCSNC